MRRPAAISATEVGNIALLPSVANDFARFTPGQRPLARLKVAVAMYTIAVAKSLSGNTHVESDRRRR
jgi:hypothetical protein